MKVRFFQSNIVYFLLKGSLSLVLEEFNNAAFITINEGYYIGEIELLSNKFKRSFSVMAAEESELLILRRVDFKTLMNQFKKELENMTDSASMKENN